jgi:hypothetical protein
MAVSTGGLITETQKNCKQHKVITAILTGYRMPGSATKFGNNESRVLNIVTNTGECRQNCKGTIKRHVNLMISQLTPWSRVLGKLIVAQLIKKLPDLMEPESTTPCS